jgi:hypothetical protein
MSSKTFTHRCGATTRTTDEPCRNPVAKEGERCKRYHGGTQEVKPAPKTENEIILELLQARFRKRFPLVR